MADLGFPVRIQPIEIDMRNLSGKARQCAFDPLLAQCQLALPFGGDGGQVAACALGRHLARHQRYRTLDDRGRVAVRHHQPRTGEVLQQRGQVFGELRAFQHPRAVGIAHRRRVRPQDACEFGIDRCGIARLAPRHEGRDVPLCLEGRGR